MKLTKKTVELICELEQIVGNQCYNPNSLNGYTWEEGCEFRYPVSFCSVEGNECRTKGTISTLDKNGVDTIRYKFGSNHLYIGNALVKVLERLENKYGLSFDELVKNHK